MLSLSKTAWLALVKMTRISAYCYSNRKHYYLLQISTVPVVGFLSQSLPIRLRKVIR